VCLDTRILCEINSDLSSADEKKFVEKNKNFWSTKKHHWRIEYSVRVLIGPADIRFELWFDKQKLSSDQPIRVEWSPNSAPVQNPMPSMNPIPAMSSMPIIQPPMSNYSYNGPAELPDMGAMSRRSTFASQPMTEAYGYGNVRQSMESSPDRTERMKRGMGGLLAKAKGGKWTVTR
jgi:hypothetical protein